MGYDLHITRKADWSEEGPDISLEEWTRLLESDSSLQRTDSFSVGFSDGTSLTYTSEGLAVWNGHSSQEPIPFDFRDGRIVVKNPDDEIIQKMVALAEKLDATVQGDEGEQYSSDNLDVLASSTLHEDRQANGALPKNSPGRILLSFVLVAFFLVVVGLVLYLRGPWQALATLCVATVVFLIQRKNKHCA